MESAAPLFAKDQVRHSVCTLSCVLLCDVYADARVCV
jgi:hypothetical protein